VNGVESVLSNSVTNYTLAGTPGTPVLSAVLCSSFTATWTANNPGNTPFEVSLSTDGFVTNFSTPITIGAGLTVNTTNIVNLTPGTTYYVRLRARNGDSVFSGF